MNKKITILVIGGLVLAGPFVPGGMNIIRSHALADETAPAAAQDKAAPSGTADEPAAPGPDRTGQNTDDNGIYIYASKKSDADKLKSSPTSTDIIEIDDTGGVSSVTELLSDRVGVQTKQFGGLGSYSTLSIRGSDPGQVAFYLDGIPLNDARSGDVNLENLPLESLERIEVYRGFTPARFGVSGIGGAVNLVTKKTGDYASSLVSGSYGSFNTGKVTLSHTQKIKSFDYMLYFNRTSTDGDFLFTDDRGTPINTDDDTLAIRENNDHQSYSAMFKGGYENDRIMIGVMDDFFYKEQGLPGTSNNNIHGIRLETIRNIASVNIKVKDIVQDTLSAGINCYYSMRQDNYDNPDSEYIGLGNALSHTGLFDSFGADVLWDLSLPGAYQYITLLASYQYELYRSREKSSYTGYETEWAPPRERHRVALALEDEILVLDDRLRIIPQIRYEYYNQLVSGDGYNEDVTGTAQSEDREFHHVGAQLGIKYNPWDGLFLKASAGRGFRAPTFTELYGDGGYITGNPSLKPEQSVSVDTGLGYEKNTKISVLDRIAAEYVFFYTLVDDRIIMLANSQYTMKAQNIDKAEIMGHELSFSLGLFEHLDLAVNYTHLTAIDKGKIPYYRNKYLPHRPVNEVSFSTKVKSKYISCSYELSYTGGNFRDRYNSAALYIRQRIIHGMTVQVFPCEELVLTLDVKNMDDNRVRDIVGYPLPGISCYGTVAVKF